MCDYSLQTAFETTGVWFLPDNPTKRIPGSISYQPTKIELHLQESFTPLREMARLVDRMPTYPIIHGVTREGEAITIIEGKSFGRSLIFKSGISLEPERVLSSCLFVGAHLTRDMRIQQLDFRVPGLPIWLSRPVIEFSEEIGNREAEPTITYRVKGLGVESTRVGSISAHLNWWISRRLAADPYSSVSGAISGWVTIAPDTPHDLSWFLDQWSKLAAIFCFTAGVTMSPDHIQGVVSDSGEKVTVLVALRDSKVCKLRNHQEFFMARSGMGSDLGKVVSTWFDIFEKVRSPSRLALSILGSDNLWLHVEFLSLMQALEGLHRAIDDDRYMTDVGYEAVKTALSNAIPPDVSEDHRRALLSRIRYGNEYSLMKRLDMLGKSLSDRIRVKILGGISDVPRSWVDTRNYYTHWDDELLSDVLDGQCMYDATVRMRHLIRVLYLCLMGIPDTSIEAALSNSCDVSQHLAQLNIRERTL